MIESKSFFWGLLLLTVYTLVSECKDFRLPLPCRDILSPLAKFHGAELVLAQLVSDGVLALTSGDAHVKFFRNSRENSSTISSTVISFWSTACSMLPLVRSSRSFRS